MLDRLRNSLKFHLKDIARDKGGEGRMKPRLRLFSPPKRVAQHTSALICLLSCALYIIVVDGEDTCVPENTPWTGMCEAKCMDGHHSELLLSGCNQTTLFSGSYSGGGNQQWIHFSNSNITRVSPRAFSGYTVFGLELKDSFMIFEDEAFAGLTVVSLWLKNNGKLTSLPSGLFRGIKGLSWLYVTHNKLQSLPAGIFHELTGLDKLDLSKNRLQSLPAGIFQELTDLDELDLTHNELRSLPAGIFQELTGLEGLYLSYNYLNPPAGIFLGLTGLNTLLIDHNSIKCFRWDLFHPLQSLQELYMKQEVDIEGLCLRTFSGLGPKVIDYKVKIDKCIVECGKSVKGLEVIDSTKPCNCNSTEGCRDCAANRVSRMKTATWRMAFIFYQVMLKIRQFDF